MPGIPPNTINIMKDLGRSLLGRKKKNKRQSTVSPEAKGAATTAPAAAVAATGPVPTAGTNEAPLVTQPDQTTPADVPATGPTSPTEGTVAGETTISDDVVKDAAAAAPVADDTRRTSIYVPTSEGAPVLAPAA